MRYVMSILVIIFGALLVIKTELFLNNFGRIEWFEQHLSTSGGSRLAYKLFGVLAIVGSLMWVTGLTGPLFLSIFGRLFGL